MGGEALPTHSTPCLSQPAAGMASVLTLAVLSYVLIALVGVQLWAGVMGGTCGYVDPSSGQWEYSPALPTYASCALPCTSFSGVCTWTFGDSWCVPCVDPGDLLTSLPASRAFPLRPCLGCSGTIYGATVDSLNGGNTGLAGNLSIPMSCAASLAPSQGQAQFDNFGRALMMAFVMVTTEGWSSCVTGASCLARGS